MVVSCRKGELPKETYYGTVEVSVVPLPNTPDIEVGFAGDKLNVLGPDQRKSFTFSSQTGKLTIFKAHTNTVLADTMIAIKPNTTQSFRFAYSKEYGLQGFVGGGKISPDSAAVHMLNNLGKYYDRYASMDLHIGLYNLNTGEIVETGRVIKEFSKVNLSSVFMLRSLDADGNFIFYFGRLKNKSTGKFIIQPGAGMDWFYLGQFTGGILNIFNMHDTDGDVSGEVIEI